MTASATGTFVSSANPTSLGTSANLLYSTDTGVLSFDRDGTSTETAVVIAKLNGVPSLSVEQFTLIA